MKKILGRLTGLAMVVAFTCQAADYSPHMYQSKIYRVALGSGSAPSAADAALVGIKPGDMVENTDDHVLYVMTATNAYVKVESDGTISSALASNKIVIGNSSGVGVAVTLSGDVKSTTSGILTIQDVSVEDNDISLASGKVIVGNSGGTGTAVTVHGDASMSSAGALSVTQLNSIAVATVTDGAALGATATQPGDNWTSTVNGVVGATLTAGAAAGATALQPDTITIVVATNGVSGCSIAVSNSLATAVHMVGWWSLTPGGAADATEFISFLDDGAGSLLSATNATTVVFVSDNTGLAQLTNLVSAAGSTNYFNVVQRDGSVTSSALIEIAGP